MQTNTATPHAPQPAAAPRRPAAVARASSPCDATQSRPLLGIAGVPPADGVRPAPRHALGRALGEGRDDPRLQAGRPRYPGISGFGIYLGFGILGFGISTPTPASSSPPSPKPNVLVILGDDIGYGDLSLHGGTTPTPRIDALARQSVELTNFMVSPLCSPSRSMLLTARHYLRTNQGPLTDGTLDTTELTIAKLFRAAGYATAMFGKWHNSYDPKTPEFKATIAKLHARPRDKGTSVLDYGFDTSWNYYGGGADYYTRVTGGGFPSWWNGNTYHPDDQGWTDDMLTDHAIDYLAANHNTGKPFFAYVACHLLHAPYQPLWEDYQKVPDSLIPKSGRLTREEFDRYTRKPNATAKDWPPEHLPSAYAAMIIAHNRNVGRLLDALDTLGLSDNTIVVYFTDNGATPQGSNLPFKGFKHSTWEGGVHVPCMIRWPGHITPATKWDGLSGAMELMPTLAAMTGIDMPPEPEGRPIDGKNIWPALQTSGPSPVENYYWTLDFEDALRTARWKTRRSVDGVELYDLANDPAETKNIAPAHPDIVKTLTAQMDAWVASTGAQLSHLPTKTKIDPAAPSGQVLKISVTLNKDAKHPGEYLQVPLAAWSEDHCSQDLLVLDLMVPRGAQPAGYRITPLDHTTPVFTPKVGVDQNARLAWDGAMPAAGYGQWERRAYGLSRDTPHPLQTIALLIGGKKGQYTIYLDNIFIQHADGTRTMLWQGAKDNPTASKLKRIPSSFTNLTVETLDLKDTTATTAK